MQSVEQADTDVSKRVQIAYEILEKHKDLVYTVINSQINNTIDADDIFQDFFLSLINRPIPASLNNMQGYLSTAIKNDVVDEVRRSQNHQKQVFCYARLRKTNTTRNDPQTITERAEVMSKVFAVIHTQLFHREAQVVLERCYHNQNVDQTAENLGINKRTVSRYLCTGLKKMRDSLKKQ